MECWKECTTLATVELMAIQGLFSLSSFAYGIELSPPPLFFFLAAIKIIVGGWDYQILVTFIIVGKW